MQPGSKPMCTRPPTWTSIPSASEPMASTCDLAFTRKTRATVAAITTTKPGKSAHSDQDDFR